MCLTDTKSPLDLQGWIKRKNRNKAKVKERRAKQGAHQKEKKMSRNNRTMKTKAINVTMAPQEKNRINRHCIVVSNYYFYCCSISFACSSTL